jgi:hypothetical protein
LKTIEERIEELVVAQVSAGQVVDVRRLAEEILYEFPGERCKEIAANISVAVIRHHGNAFWEKEECELPGSESLWRIAIRQVQSVRAAYRRSISTRPL